MTTLEKRKAEGICIRCGARFAEDGRRTCGICAEKDRQRQRERYAQSYKSVSNGKKGQTGKSAETIDDICRMARKHNLSYGKYLEKRAQGMYLDE